MKLISKEIKAIFFVLMFFSCKVSANAAVEKDTTINFIILINKSLGLGITNEKLIITENNTQKTETIDVQYIPGTLTLPARIYTLLNNENYKIELWFYHYSGKTKNNEYYIAISDYYLKSLDNISFRIYSISDLDILRNKLKYKNVRDKEYIIENNISNILVVAEKRKLFRNL